MVGFKKRISFFISSQEGFLLESDHIDNIIIFRDVKHPFIEVEYGENRGRPKLIWPGKNFLGTEHFYHASCWHDRNGVSIGKKLKRIELGTWLVKGMGGCESTLSSKGVTQWGDANIDPPSWERVMSLLQFAEELGLLGYEGGEVEIPHTDKRWFENN